MRERCQNLGQISENIPC